MTVRDEFSNQAFALQVLVDDGDVPRVTQVVVGRRPPGLYGGADRSHLTAWRVFVDGVRNHLVGLTVPEALARVILLGERAELHRANSFAGELRDVDVRKLNAVQKATESKGTKRTTDDALHDDGPPPKKARLEAATADAPAPEDGPDAERERVEAKTPRTWNKLANAHWAEAKAAALLHLASLLPADLDSSGDAHFDAPDHDSDLDRSADAHFDAPDHDSDLDTSGDTRFDAPDHGPTGDTHFDAPDHDSDLDTSGDADSDAPDLDPDVASEDDPEGGDVAWSPLPAVDVELALLQRLITAHLHHRNTLPLTAIPEARPRGGAIAAGNLIMAAEADRDAAWDDAQQEKHMDALWKLFDVGALENLITGKQGYLFGTAEVDPKEVCFAAVADHIMSVETAYPSTAARCRLRSWERPIAGDTFEDWKEDLDTVGDDLPEPLDADQVTGLRARPAASSDESSDGSHGSDESPGGSDGSHASDGERSADETGTPWWDDLETGADVYDRFAVQLDLAEDGTIRQMYVGGRPKSLPGQKGRHTTAWVALCDYVRRLVIGRDVRDVGIKLTDAMTFINDLHDACEEPRPPRLRQWGGTALECAQLQIADFLTLLNRTEAAMVDTGGLSGGGAESRNRHRRVSANAGPFAGAVAMIDPLCPAKLLQYTAEGDETDNVPMPGYFDVIALRIGLHLGICATLYDQPELLGVQGLALLHAAIGMAPSDAHDLNEKIFAVLAGPDEVYDEDEFDELYDGYAAERDGSQDEAAVSDSGSGSQSQNDSKPD